MKKNLTTTLLAMSLAACGGEGDSGNNSGGSGTPYTPITAPSESNDEHVRKMTFKTQEELFSNYAEEKEYIQNFGSQWVHIGGSLCSFGHCMENSNPLNEDDNPDEYDPLHNDKRLALQLEEGRTLRYRTSNDLGTDDDNSGQFVQIYINENEMLTPAREKMVRDAVAQMESVIGHKVFNGDIKFAQMAQFGHKDIVLRPEFDEDGNIIKDANFDYQNVWTGLTQRYTPSSSEPEKGDSYQKLINRDGVRGGIIFSFGTAPRIFGDLGCELHKANIAPYPLGQESQGFLIDEQGYFTNENWVWVNLGQPIVTDDEHGACYNVNEINQDIAIHELGHAVGLFAHFDDYGTEHGVWGKNVETVIKTIYNNPVNSNIETLDVYY